MRKIYLIIDSLWQWIAEKLFVRFQFEIPVESLKQQLTDNKVVFCLTNGGIIDWLILSSWCRKNGFGPILVANRLRILALAKPLFFFPSLVQEKVLMHSFFWSRQATLAYFFVNRVRDAPFWSDSF